MRLVSELWRRILHLGRRGRFQANLSEEMEFHIESRAEELERSGMPKAAALAKARHEFGSTLRASEDTQEAWEFGWLVDAVSDLRYAGRALRRNPGFSFAAVACLTIGIGANTTIFSITTSLLFSEPSCRDASSMIAIREGGNSSSSIVDYRFMRESGAFEGTAGINPEKEINWRNGDRSRRLYAAFVTDDYFGTLGTPFLLGRGIDRGETDTVVLSHRLWAKEFGADPQVLGRYMVLDGRPHTIVGVLPEDHRTIFGFGFSPEVHVPVVRDDEIVAFYARMPKGMTMLAARDQLKNIFSELDRVHPRERWKRAENIRVTGVTGLDVLGQNNLATIAAFFAALLIAVGLVLLIACTNVTGLLLARASSRAQELAIRLSLGASRTRLIRHLLAESLLLSILGAIAGLALNLICSRLISAWTLPLPVPIRLVVAPDWRLLLYCIGIVLISALVCGLLPALKAVRRDVNVTLKRGERQVERTWGLRSVMVTGQIAVSTVLLVTGFLFIHNLLRAVSMNPGFDTTSTIWAYMRLVPESYQEQDRQAALVRTALENLQRLPGIDAVSITRRVPLNDNCMIGIDVTTDLSETSIPVRYQCNKVGPDYFRAIGIPLLRGREFTMQDRRGSPIPVIVNESFARNVFGKAEPVGRTISGSIKMVVVGVVKDSKYFTLGEQQRWALYEPYFASDEPPALSFIVRSAGSPLSQVKPINDVLSRLDTAAAIEVKPMRQALGLALLPSQIGGAMMGMMGVLSLALASIGLYGILLYSVSRRFREIGLRVALGATPAAILGTVCRRSFGLVGLGLTIGLGLALVCTRPLAMFLVPGLSATDPASFGAVVGVLTLVGLAATLTPALRAIRADPMTALRHE